MDSSGWVNLGGSLACLLILASLLWVCRQLWVSFNPREVKREGEEEFVTRHELAQALGRIETSINNLVGRNEYDLRNRDLEKRLDQLDEYLHQRTHDLLSTMNAISLKLDTTALLIQREIGRREGARRGDGYKETDPQ